MNRKNYLKRIVYHIVCFAMIGYFTAGGFAYSQGVVPPSLKYSIDIAKMDARIYSPDAYQLEKLYRVDNGKDGLPLQAGFSIKTALNFNNAGQIFNWPSGERSWILKIIVNDAPSILLTFEDVALPEGASIFVYSPIEGKPIAVLSAKDVVSKTLSCPVVTGSEVVIEYVETTLSNGFSGKFSISDVVFIANGLDALSSKDLGESDPCQVNINCTEGNNWQLQKRGVARILFREGSGWYWCSGTLINNTAQDAKPYFLTAEHCGGSASAADRNVWQFYFNYERATCANTGTPPTNLITGCTLLAKGPISGGSDFQLVELSSAPQQSWNPYYNGWSRNTTGSLSGVSIHHPSGDAKKISTYTTQLTSASPNIGGSLMATNSAWRVNWSATANGHGVTEGGSSGSPIFNADGLVVGTLSGGASTCTNPTLADYYGKFDYHWQSNGATNADRLAPWLDPNSSNPTSLGGFDPYAGLFAEFVANTTQIYVNGSVTFTDLSAGGTISSWSWNFGEGANPATATGQGPHTVTYTTVGQKTVTLTINGDIIKTKVNYINVAPSIFVAPSGLAAQVQNDKDVHLTWNYPAILNTEGFEGYDNFALSFAPWIQHDVDGRPTYNIENTTFTNQGYTGSFIIFNHAATTPALSASWAARTGEKSAICFDAVPDGAITTNNDWLVSPRIKVQSGYSLKFWAKSITEQWGLERLKVGISTTGSNPADFTIISPGSYLSVPTDWTEYTYSLSSYIGNYIRFALNCVSADAFALLIDDISVTDGSGKTVFAQGFENLPVASEHMVKALPTGESPKAQMLGEKEMMEISGYKVYRNDVAIATLTNPDVLEYNDTNLPIGEFTYKVSATYSSPEGESVPSNTVSVTITDTGIIPDELSSVNVFPNPFNQQISIANAQRVKHVEVTNVLGQKVITFVNNGNEMLSIETSKLPTGVYIINIISVENSSRIVKMIKR